jgi:hypothetical protein
MIGKSPQSDGVSMGDFTEFRLAAVFLIRCITGREGAPARTGVATTGRWSVRWSASRIATAVDQPLASPPVQIDY